jgi:MYXO-CTERM domain-containing protein
MNRNHTLLGLAALTLLATTASAGIVDLAISTFDTDAEGWTVRDTVNGQVTYFNPSWNATGGVPTGNIEFSDISPGGYVFQAPDAFTGDFSLAVTNGGVAFDWMADQIQDGKRASVILWRNSARLWASSDPDPAAGVWHSFNFVFNMSVDWQIDYGSGAQQATMADLSYVLSDVTGMDITGETWTGMIETTWLDNPRIHARNVPAPGALALLGIASLAGTRRRRNA